MPPSVINMPACDAAARAEGGKTSVTVGALRNVPERSCVSLTKKGRFATRVVLGEREEATRQWPSWLSLLFFFLQMFVEIRGLLAADFVILKQKNKNKEKG